MSRRCFDTSCRQALAIHRPSPVQPAHASALDQLAAIQLSSVHNFRVVAPAACWCVCRTGLWCGSPVAARRGANWTSDQLCSCRQGKTDCWSRLILERVFLALTSICSTRGRSSIVRIFSRSSTISRYSYLGGAEAMMGKRCVKSGQEVAGRVQEMPS